jgi:hypothetical protein
VTNADPVRLTGYSAASFFCVSASFLRFSIFGLNASLIDRHSVGPHWGRHPRLQMLTVAQLLAGAA